MDDTKPPPPPEGPVKRKRGPPKGSRVAGRQKGTRNKETIAREEAARIARERLAEIDRITATGQSTAVAAVETAGMKRGKDVLAELMRAYMALTALHQPWPGWHERLDEKTKKPILDKSGRKILDNDNPNFDEKRFKEYSLMARDTAAAVAPFHDPRYSAMMIGATVVNKIEVVGGMPDEFKAPAKQEISPGTIITPDDDVIVIPAAGASAA
jgi:hypothetical protein